MFDRVGCRTSVSSVALSDEYSPQGTECLWTEPSLSFSYHDDSGTNKLALWKYLGKNRCTPILATKSGDRWRTGRNRFLDGHRTPIRKVGKDHICYPALCPPTGQLGCRSGFRMDCRVDCFRSCSPSWFGAADCPYRQAEHGFEIFDQFLQFRLTLIEILPLL